MNKYNEYRPDDVQVVVTNIPSYCGGCPFYDFREESCFYLGNILMPYMTNMIREGENASPDGMYIHEDCPLVTYETMFRSMFPTKESIESGGIETNITPFGFTTARIVPAGSASGDCGRSRHG